MSKSADRQGGQISRYWRDGRLARLKRRMRMDESKKLQPQGRPATQCEKELAKCLCDCQDKCHELQTELTKHRWIPVSERLPELRGISPNKHSIDIWVYTADGDPSMGFYTESQGFRQAGSGVVGLEVTHWKPIILPEQALKNKK